MSINVKTGDIIGIYKVLGDSTKSVDGHKRLRVKCIVCGLEKDIRPINLGATVCNHKQKIVVKNCEFCGKPIPYTSNTRVTDYNRRRFCSVSCAAKINNKRLHSDDSKLKAVASIIIDDCFVIHDIKVIEGNDEFFIAMPSRKTPDGEFKDIAHPINTETRELIKSKVISAYHKALSEEE